MTNEMREMIDNYEVSAERRGIYRFIENDGSDKGKLALVISSADRANDRLVSILILKQKSSPGLDVIGVTIPEMGDYFMHCGLVTYCKRINLGEMVHKLSKPGMKRINRQIEMELGLSNRSRNGVMDDDVNYEKLYKDLLQTVKGVN